MIEDKSGRFFERYFDLLKKKGKERKRETRWKESVARPATGSQFPIPSSSRKIHQTLHDQLPSHCDPPRFDRTHYVCPLIFPRAIDKKKGKKKKKSWPFPRLTSAQLSPILWHGRRLERDRKRERNEQNGKELCQKGSARACRRGWLNETAFRLFLDSQHTQANPFTNTRVVHRIIGQLPVARVQETAPRVVVWLTTRYSFSRRSSRSVFPSPGILKRVLKRAEGGQTITIMS